ncbi:MAG: hypothetical protein ABSG92_02060 [Conexivisphaerales archaeon]
MARKKLHPLCLTVLVHQIYGLDDYIKSVSAELATAGFSVAAVNLSRDYRGRLSRR